MTSRLSTWWAKWKPWTSDFEGRAFWIGFGSIWDLSGRLTRHQLEELGRDREAAQAHSLADPRRNRRR